ncbi:MAG TPA: hypothetical protein VFT47_08855 [Vicinamibacterales bacterium]|nr:hypothetical protein [Vicinamibacterales bacterium]
MVLRRLLTLVALAILSMAQAPRQSTLAVLEPATRVSFPVETDSNSPLFWRLRNGVTTLNVLNSTGAPTLSSGNDLNGLTLTRSPTMKGAPPGGWWMEAVVPDYRQVLYGYYHNEQPDVCPGNPRSAPRIGAAKSFDGGRSWIDLGFVIEAPPGSTQCQTANRYFVGGVGDCSAVLDQNRQWLYIFFSAYPRDIEGQGVAVARIRWSDRDAPAGRVAVWNDGAWRYPVLTDDERFAHEPARPIFRAERSFHARSVDGFWGPSVHWNSFLEQYVMLLNRAYDGEFSQEGIYISSNKSLDDPTNWTSPQRLLSGGKWYPQVVGTDAGSGSDRLAGERARLFVGGVSMHEIVFRRPDQVAVPRQ